jgi:hypothetical protein
MIRYVSNRRDGVEALALRAEGAGVPLFVIELLFDRLARASFEPRRVMHRGWSRVAGREDSVLAFESGCFRCCYFNLLRLPITSAQLLFGLVQIAEGSELTEPVQLSKAAVEILEKALSGSEEDERGVNWPKSNPGVSPEAQA